LNFLRNRKKVDFFNDINPISFRSYQYEYLLDFIESTINFVSQQKGDYLEVIDKSMSERINYTGVYNSKFTKIEFQVKNKLNQEKNQFICFYMPTLIEKNHFILNGKYYTPGLYLVDYPITVKKKSIMISSLFNSITFYNNDDIVIFTGRNFRLDSFIQLFIDHDNGLYQKYIQINKLNHDKWDEENLVELYSSKFSCKKDLESIRNKIECLFFDNYTYELYRKCYNLEEVNLKTIILLSFEYFLKGENSFNDLNNKRLVFIEFLLRPLLNRISGLATEVSKGVMKDHLKIDELMIPKYFLTSVDLNNPTGKKQMGLNGNYIYDTKNLYSSILQPKATFLTPGMNAPPNEVKHLHKTHYKKICPITISSQKPGETISLIPDAKINEFGMFI